MNPHEGILLNNEVDQNYPVWLSAHDVSKEKSDVGKISRKLCKNTFIMMYAIYLTVTYFEKSILKITTSLHSI